MKLKKDNVVYFDSIVSYFNFIDILNNKDCLIAGNSANSYNIINLCEYETYKSFDSITKTNYMGKYLSDKLSSMDECLIEEVLENILKIDSLIKQDNSVYFEDYNPDIFDIVLYLLQKQKVKKSKSTIEAIVNKIISNKFTNIIIIYDSNSFSLNKENNVIFFDIKKEAILQNIDIIFSGDIVFNINFDIIIDNFFKYWPIPSKKKVLTNLINNNFLFILGTNSIKTYNDNIAILAKLINHFYSINNKIQYLGNTDIVKSFLSSSLNY